MPANPPKHVWISAIRKAISGAEGRETKFRVLCTELAPIRHWDLATHQAYWGMTERMWKKHLEQEKGKVAA